jgi:hypothetical protein
MLQGVMTTQWKRHPLKKVKKKAYVVPSFFLMERYADPGYRRSFILKAP